MGGGGGAEIVMMSKRVVSEWVSEWAGENRAYKPRHFGEETNIKTKCCCTCNLCIGAMSTSHCTLQDTCKYFLERLVTHYYYFFWKDKLELGLKANTGGRWRKIVRSCVFSREEEEEKNLESGFNQSHFFSFSSSSLGSMWVVRQLYSKNNLW